MVKYSGILCGALAWFLAGPCLAGDNETTYVITTPIFQEWDDGSNMTVTLRVINADYAWEYANTTSDLSKRTRVSTVATVVKTGADVITVAKGTKEIWEFVAGIIKSKSDAESCTLTYGTDLSGEYFYGYAYKATTTGKNCDTTAERKTILNAVDRCAKKLQSKGAAVGCCTFAHGGNLAWPSAAHC
ncbi:Ras-like protein [Penicillium malachiteum]|uniref:Ras-like protein n=1 Tax=Penicillium malachiteum TaxID=1324776 RepID=UPI002548A3CA|nr:Ras-like protein [Penicillium malachiteum]KAJ5715388.1 Ras-like protein [Penicillium malachiteum]